MKNMFLQCIELWERDDSVTFLDDISDQELYLFIIASMLIIDLMASIDLAWFTHIKQTDFLQEYFQIRLLNFGLLIDAFIDVVFKAKPWWEVANQEQDFHG